MSTYLDRFARRAMNRDDMEATRPEPERQNPMEHPWNGCPTCGGCRDCTSEEARRLLLACCCEDAA